MLIIVIAVSAAFVLYSTILILFLSFWKGQRRNTSSLGM